MLTEQFVVAVGVSVKAASTNALKDAAIFSYEHQPLLQQRHIFKKSAAPPNCLAVSATHIFAAQIEKAVVHVYSRERNNQEAIVPFPERITCLALACNDTVLILGTAEGRILLWETASGRQITTAQAHLQAVTVLKTDPRSNFVVSVSADSTAHVWSLSALLSFATVDVLSLSPILAFTHHRTEIVALAISHGNSFNEIVVTAAKDRTCLVWELHTGNVLRTFLLPTIPTCVALDAAARYAYVGNEDCSILQLDLYNLADASDPLAPIQPSSRSFWASQDTSIGTVLSLSVSFDSCTILTGHDSGAVGSWDASRGQFSTRLIQNPLPGPVTNLVYMHVTGFATTDSTDTKILNVVKPRFGAFDNADGAVPANYSIGMELSPSSTEQPSSFLEALTAPTFPENLLDTGITELASWGRSGGQVEHEAEDYMSLSDGPNGTKMTVAEQNEQLRLELEALRRVQTASFDSIKKLKEEKAVLLHKQRSIPAVNGGSHDLGESSDEY